MKTKFLWAAVALASLAACGGGGGGGGVALPFTATPLPGQQPNPEPNPEPNPPEPNPEPNPANSSAACFNEADLREGTKLVVEQTITSGDQTQKQRVTRLTRGREVFRDASAVEQLRTVFNYFNSSEAQDRLYLDFVDGNIVRYGTRNGGTGTSAYAYNDPTIRTPVMTPGQTINENYVVWSVEGEIRNEQRVSGTRTYVGRESLETAVGTFQTCRFSATVRFRQIDGSELTQVQENWIAAEGPYRGQDLKLAVRTGDVLATFAPTQITYEPK
ncbi:hypothetical protein [Variovorax sp.]|jgi:hypothetical protein|uniref:hypothetical protein n=1 Tax=Variovorax sp. TaxID=1871043 RepID=UPI000C3C0C2E|nr:hypothetical protein [Variovorax sp.]MBS80518.1 hypothetical protein [Variovorax sp.]